MEAVGAAAAERALAMETTAVAAQVAAICDKIKEHRDAGKTMSVRRAAVIAAMIDDIAAPDAEVMPARVSKRKARKGAARWNSEVSRLDERKSGVVVKSVRPGSGDGDIGEILREACFMAACRGHPSVVGYRGVTRILGTEGDAYSLVLDGVGPSIAGVLRDYCTRPFKEAEVRRVMRQLLGAAKAMAERGIVHRDIKPANILFAGNGGAVTISNFSAAKYVGEKDPPSRFAGTNGYMAPEVLLENADHGTLADAWSLGCVMVELLTGKLPFAGKDKNDQLDGIFDVIGVPGRKALQALKPHVLVDEVQLRRARQRLVGHRSRLRELVPEQVLSQDGFEVLEGLLTVDPKKRLTADAALQCPWFADNTDDALVLSTTVSKIAGAATKYLSMLWQMTVSSAGVY